VSTEPLDQSCEICDADDAEYLIPGPDHDPEDSVVCAVCREELT
jgi:hypothetical protein